MNTGLLVSLMFACGIIVAAIPFLCFIMSAIVLGIQGITLSVTLMMFAITILMTFLLSAASFTYLQYNSCKKVNNVKKIFANAGIAAGIQFITLIAIYFLGLKSIPINMLPSWISAQETVREGIGYGYFTFFASTFGTVIGGTLSAIC
jgi:hypothetical protein